MGNVYQFVETDAAQIVAQMVSSYEALTGETVSPSSPEKLIIEWAASVIVQERVRMNVVGNQNIPSQAIGSNLDSLGELFFGITRPQATKAQCTVRFSISAAQSSAVLIPAGTRVTDINSTLFWETLADAYISIGSTYADITVQCQTAGIAGNGYAAGQINTLVDSYSYASTVANTDTSDGGSDEATDEEYYNLMRDSMFAPSTAGAKGTYEYYAKAVSTEIADVCANTPSAGTVKLYTLMSDGTIAGSVIKALVLAACNADGVRPLTDSVSTGDATYSDYNINITYYISTDSQKSQAEIASDVSKAVDKYVEWQCAKFGRDINPDKLREYLLATGIKRVTVTAPVYTALTNGDDNNAPQVARLGTRTVTNGGYEDE